MWGNQKVELQEGKGTMKPALTLKRPRGTENGISLGASAYMEAEWSCPPLALETSPHCGVEGSGITLIHSVLRAHHVPSVCYSSCQKWTVSDPSAQSEAGLAQQIYVEDRTLLSILTNQKNCFHF